MRKLVLQVALPLVLLAGCGHDEAPEAQHAEEPSAPPETTVEEAEPEAPEELEAPPVEPSGEEDETLPGATEAEPLGTGGLGLRGAEGGADQGAGIRGAARPEGRDEEDGEGAFDMEE